MKQRITRYVSLLMVTVLMVCLLAPISQAEAVFWIKNGDKAVIQPTVNFDVPEIVTGVFVDSADPGKWKEVKRIGEDDLADLRDGKALNLYKQLEADGYLEDGKTRENQGGKDLNPVLGFGSGSTEDINRAAIVNNVVKTELNRAYTFMYGDKTCTPTEYYHNLFALFSKRVTDNSYDSKMADKTMNASDYCKLTNSKGETEYFAYRMPKGYNRTDTTRDWSSCDKLLVNNEDIEFITWEVIAYEAFINVSMEDKLLVTSETVYSGEPSDIEKVIVNLLNSVINFIVGALGLWNLDELVLNQGIRGSYQYVGGIFPASWEPILWTFFYIIEIVAIAVLFFNIIFNIYRRAQSTVNPVVRAESMEQAKDLLLTILLLIFLPYILQIIIKMSTSLTTLFAGTLGDKSADAQFANMRAGSNVLGGCLMQLVYFVLLLYFNFFYVMRSITLVVLIVLAPIFIMFYSTSASGKQLLMGYIKQLMVNLLIQPIQALCLVLILLLPLQGRTFEQIVLLYALIPLTSLIRETFFSGAGGALDMFSKGGASAMKKATETTLKATAGAAVGLGMAGKSLFHHDEDGNTGSDIGGTETEAADASINTTNAPINKEIESKPPEEKTNPWKDFWNDTGGAESLDSDPVMTGFRKTTSLAGGLGLAAAGGALQATGHNYFAKTANNASQSTLDHFKTIGKSAPIASTPAAPELQPRTMASWVNELPTKPSAIPTSRPNATVQNIQSQYNGNGEKYLHDIYDSAPQTMETYLESAQRESDRLAQEREAQEQEDTENRKIN